MFIPVVPKAVIRGISEVFMTGFMINVNIRGILFAVVKAVEI